MARLTMAQAYAYARKAGFDPAGATIMAAISMAESGLVTDARGDVGLQTSHWGPSVGLTQIRTVKSETGKGTDRDISRLTDPLQNMISAYHISGKGKDFSPWATYNDKKYQDYLGQAQGAAGATTGGVPVENVGFLDLSADELGAKAQSLGLLLLAIAAGGALVVLGGKRSLT